MTTTERLVDQLRRSAEGDAWHGPSVREALEGVTVSDASAHPIPGAHSIRELVLHMAAGIQLVLRRLNGDGRQLTAEEDWPAPSEATDDAWQRDEIVGEAETPIPIPCLDVDLTLDAIYRRVDLPAVGEPEGTEYEA